MAKKGRPSTFNQKIADEICEGLAMGYSIRTVLKPDHMPAISTFFRWMREHEDFQKQYARSKQEAADAMAEDLLDIVDDGTNDWMTINKGGYEMQVVDKEAVMRSRLRADTRRWLMSKMKPKKYGDKLDLTSEGKRIETTPIVVSDIKSRNADPETKTTSGS